MPNASGGGLFVSTYNEKSFHSKLTNDVQRLVVQSWVNKFLPIYMMDTLRSGGLYSVTTQFLTNIFLIEIATLRK